MDSLTRDDVILSMLSWIEESILSLNEKIQSIKLIISSKVNNIINLKETWKIEDFYYELEINSIANYQLYLFDLEFRLNNAISYKKNIELIMLWSI